MSILHMVSQPNRFWDCLARISNGDAILLLHEGVLEDVDAVRLASFPVMSMHILCEHTTLTREIDFALSNRFQLIDFTGFVSLTERHQTTIFWGQSSVAAEWSSFDSLIQTTEDGFLVDSSSWNETVAEWLASTISLTLTEKHWEIIRFLREYHARFQHLPNNRLFVKAVSRALGAERGNSLYLNALFLGSPVKYACLVAGLPKPPGCL